MKVPLLDLTAQYRAIRTEIDAAVAGVFESQMFIGGPEVEACEAGIAAYSRVAHAVGVSSGTDALLAALMAECIGPGDEVITTPYTFFATAGSISRTGAKPVFVDILPSTYNIDPALIEARITAKTRAIIPVHLYGQMADMDTIMAIARRHNLIVIEDAAQAIGAEYKGRRAGSIGDYGCFSFFPSKNLGGAGDGGMIVTQDEGRARKLRVLRNHGMDPKYYHTWIGGNFRLDALQAAVVRVKLKHLEAWTAARQVNAARYSRWFQDAGLAVTTATPPRDKIILPEVLESRHIFNQYVIRIADRDARREALARHGVATEIYYPQPLHLQNCFTSLNGKAGDHPHSEAAARETIALPIYPELTEAQARHVFESITAVLASAV